MSKFSAIDYKYRVFRCFAVYNCNTKQCGNLYNETIMKVTDFVKLNLQDSQRNQLFISTGDRSEWHGILEEKSNCYFLMMTFPGTQQAEVRSSLLDLQFTVMGINNYQKYIDENFPKQKKDELMIRLDDLEKKYVEKFQGEGQPNENEVQNQNQGSKITDQFLYSKPLQIHSSKVSQKIQEQYRKNGVYRCFMVFNVPQNKILFLHKRGTNKSYLETEGQLMTKLKTQINETTKFDFFMSGNMRSDWHGILDDQKSCYFLMMTFPSSTQKNVREALSDLKKIFTSYPNYDRASQHDLEKKFKTEISKSIDNLEIIYHNINGNEGVPSDEEQSLRDTFIQSNDLPNKYQQQPIQNKQQQSSKISLEPPMSKIQENLDPPNDIGGSSNILVSTVMDIQKEVKLIESFKPNAQDAVKLMFAGIGFSFIIFTVLLVDLYS